MKIRARSTVYFLVSLAIIFSLAFFVFHKKQTLPPGKKQSQSSSAQTAGKYPETILSTPYSDKLVISQTKFPDRVCDISDFGAVSGGKVSNTEAIARAITSCADQGGGKVVVPPGVWLTGPVKLKSNIDLEVQAGAELRFDPDPEDYLPVVFSRFEGIEYYNFSPPVYASNCDNIAITGQGELNGQGQIKWWALPGTLSEPQLYAMGEKNIPVAQRVFGKAADGLRPAFIEFVNCDVVKVAGLKIVNGPMWTIHPLYSQNITIKNVDIETAAGRSTDGVAVDSSRNVLVENSVFDTGDDAIVLKSGRDADGRRVGKPTENVVALDNHIINAHGAFTIGSEMSGGIQNVLVQNTSIDKAKYGFRAKSNSDRGGTVENIWMENTTASELTTAAIQLNMFYEQNVVSQKDQHPPVFQNINITGFDCKDSADSINLLGLPGSHMKNINLENITVTKSRSRLKMQNVSHATLADINLNPKYGPVFDLTDSQNVTLSGCSCPLKMKTCLLLSGTSSRGIRLIDDSFDRDSEKISTNEGAEKSQVKITARPEAPAAPAPPRNPFDSVSKFFNTLFKKIPGFL